VRSKRSAKFSSRTARCTPRLGACLSGPCSPHPTGRKWACALATKPIAESYGAPAMAAFILNRRSRRVHSELRFAQVATSASKIRSLSRTFSASSASVQKSAHLIENIRQAPICNRFIFNQFRTLFHSFPGSPLFAICSPKQRGVYPSVFQFGTPAPRLHAAPRSMPGQSEHSRLPYILVASNTAHPGRAARRNRGAEVWDV
jgi:hypothetical protein